MKKLGSALYFLGGFYLEDNIPHLDMVLSA